MPKIVKISLSVAVIITIVLFNAIARGAETTLVVNLQREIRSDFRKMAHINKTQDEKSDRLNKEIKEIVTELTNTTDENRKEELRQLYFKKRAEHLKAEVIRVVEIENALGRIIKNMITLDRVMNKTINGEEGFNLSNTEYIKNSFRGMANILKPIHALKPDDPRVSNMAITLANLDMQFRRYFGPEGRTSLKKQIEYLEDLHAYVHSVRSLLRQEALYLKSNIFYLMKDGIVRVINDFQKDFYAPSFKGFETQHRQDKEVLGEKREIGMDGVYYNPDFDAIGNW